MLSRLSELLAPHGLTVRGTIPDPRVGGDRQKPLVLVGNVGDRFWDPFTRWQRAQPAGLLDPLDRWTADVVRPIATEVGAEAVFPFDRPYPPFQIWAMQAEGLRPSPLGILMHPVHGLWHAYRAALILPVPIAIAAPEPSAHPCDTCQERACLRRCPIGAHGASGFAYAACVDRLRSGAACMNGCFDRNACPVGTDFRYRTETQHFLAEAFIRGAGTATPG